jgi:hypothetical protein
MRRFPLAILAAIAVLALTAGAARAAEFHGEVEHTTLTGTQETKHVITLNAGSTHCAKSTNEGTSSAKTESRWTLSIVFAECKLTAFGGESLASTIDTNGLHITLTILPFGLHITSGTEAGKSLQLTAPFCTITIGPQSLAAAKYTNVGAGTTREVIVTTEVSKLKYTQSAFCPTGGGTFENGTYTGTTRVTGEDTAGGHVGIWYE